MQATFIATTLLSLFQERGGEERGGGMGWEELTSNKDFSAAAHI